MYTEKNVEATIVTEKIYYLRRSESKSQATASQQVMPERALSEMVMQQLTNQILEEKAANDSEGDRLRKYYFDNLFSFPDEPPKDRNTIAPHDVH